MTQAGYTLKAQNASAEASLKAYETMANTTYGASMTMANATQQSSQLSADGGLLLGQSNVAAQNFSSVNGSLAHFRKSLSRLDADEKKSYADNFVDLLSKNNDATSQRLAKLIEQEPDKLDLLAEQYENYLKGVPIGGSIASTLGLNKDAMNSWMRTEGFKDLGQWIFGDPNTGKGGAMTGLIMPTSNMDIIAKRNQEILGNNSGNALVYQRTDSTMINPMTGQKMSNNVIDMTDPNNVIDYSKNPSVNGIVNQPNRQMPQFNTGGAMPKMTKQQKANMANLNRLMKSNPNFLPTLQRESWKRGINPNDMLNMLAIESSFRKDVITHLTQVFEKRVRFLHG